MYTGRNKGLALVTYLIKFFEMFVEYYTTGACNNIRTFATERGVWPMQT